MRSCAPMQAADAETHHSLQKYCGEPILRATRLSYAGNNQIYKVTSASGSSILKIYATAQSDGYDRGTTEFRAVQNLWSSGFRNIPEPLAFFPDDKVAVYSFEDGDVLEPHEVGATDVLAMADFLTAACRAMDGVKADFPPERTACLCLRSYAARVEQRIETVAHSDVSGEIAAEARRFLLDTVLPEFYRVKDQFLARADALKLDVDQHLPLENQVLGPADIGIHNMLSAGDRHVFLDFEYFGRDDPVRPVLHFLHHDRSRDLPYHLKDLFLRRLREQGFPLLELEDRLNLIDPLIGMDWVVLYLNVFCTDRWAFRQGSMGRVLEQRLRKARDKVRHLRYHESACG